MYNDDYRINKTIRKIMIDRGMRVDDIAAASKKSKQTISTTLNDSKNLSIATIESFADVLNCDVKIQFIQRDTGKIIDCG